LFTEELSLLFTVLLRLIWDLATGDGVSKVLFDDELGIVEEDRV
jgi:hypothetical protein